MTPLTFIVWAEVANLVNRVFRHPNLYKYTYICVLIKALAKNRSDSRAKPGRNGGQV